METVDTITDKHCHGLSCSQTILAAYGGRYQISEELAIRLSAGFHYGLGRQGQICGAVAGSILIIGLARSTGSPHNPIAQQKVDDAVQHFMEEFGERCGSTNCRELLGCDISTDAGYAEARGRQLYDKLCVKYIDTAVEILEETLHNTGLEHCA